jgi:U3 small nucleolar RNA-associated protein 25
MALLCCSNSFDPCQTQFVLSAIQVVVVDYADVIYMQNWQNLVIVFEHLNQLPTKQHGSDLMRTREWYLNGWAKFYRQTIILSSTTTAG